MWQDRDCFNSDLWLGVCSSQSCYLPIHPKLSALKQQHFIITGSVSQEFGQDQLECVFPIVPGISTGKTPTLKSLNQLGARIQRLCHSCFGGWFEGWAQLALSIRTFAHGFSMWFGFLTAYQLGFKRECPQNEHAKRVRCKMLAFSDLSLEVMRHPSCILLVPS